MRRDRGFRLLKGGFEFFGRHIADASGALSLVFRNAGTRSHLISRRFGKKAGAHLVALIPTTRIDLLSQFSNPHRTLCWASQGKGARYRLCSKGIPSLRHRSFRVPASPLLMRRLQFMPYFSPSAPALQGGTRIPRATSARPVNSRAVSYCQRFESQRFLIVDMPKRSSSDSQSRARPVARPIPHATALTNRVLLVAGNAIRDLTS